MSKAQPNPGSKYIVRERIGKGRWKEVYRAVVRGEWHDRALARFIKEPRALDLFDEIKLLVDTKGAGKLENVAELYRAFKGADGDIYLEEELLYRPLESLAPLKMVDQFFRIARDLCNGLASLHNLGRVHRDLKLDNCGVDHLGTAKIFDLGSVTSEGGGVKGTTLSRAPELFAANAKCTKTTDVWAMGAVLFALRTGGEYPFVTKEEARTRPLAGRARQHFDRMVRERAESLNAEEILKSKVKEEFPNGSGELISAMLSFDPPKRPTAAECVDKWRSLLNQRVPAKQMESANLTEREFQEIVAYLNAVIKGSSAMSSLQWERVAAAIENIEPKLNPEDLTYVQELKKKLEPLREAVAV